MTYALLLVAATLVGWAVRERLRERFPVLFRGQQLLIGGSLAIAAGWTLELNAELAATVLALIAAEWMTLLGVRTLHGPALLGSAAHANAGFWSLPVTSFLAPAAMPVAVANSTLGLLRGVPVMAWLRSDSPRPQTRRTGFVDFAPATGLVLGWMIGLAAAPPGWTGLVLDGFARSIGVYGGFLLAAALPARFPPRTAWRAASPALAIRFLAPSLIVVAIAATGVPLSPVVWIVSLAPVPLNTLVLARVYELDAELAAAQLALTSAVAIVLLPLVWWAVA